jgi:ligand-binding SRPBCC domain-containing protein
MRFRQAFRVRAPLAAVSAFHRRSDSLTAITPPPAGLRIERAPAVLSGGDELSMVLHLGPLPIRWLAVIDEVSPRGFVDRQVRGPFRSWVHRHSFVPLGEHLTMVVDQVEASPRRHPLWGPVGLVIWSSLPFLFAYRRWKTRRLLEGAGGGEASSGARARGAP